MITAIITRSETVADASAIRGVTAAAFAGNPNSDGLESGIIERLRIAGKLTISLVAVDGGTIVGHIAVSPVELTSGHSCWFGLGPVSVVPGRQRAGVGTALICDSLSRLRDRGASGCVVLGSPSYYGRFGFKVHSQFVLPGFSPSHFLALSFGAPVPVAEVHYHASFSAI